MEKKMKQSTDINSKLPADIVHQLIFSKLSIVDLQACRQVCKAWKNIVAQFFYTNNLYFAQTSPGRKKIECMEFGPKHMGVMNSLASFTYHPKYSSAFPKILCSSHGLLLCSFHFSKRTQICILNPFTNEYFHVSSYTKNGITGVKHYSYGFGLSLNTNHFKIVRFTHKETLSDPSTSIHIFAFGTSLRPRPRPRPLGFLPTSIQTKGAYYFNGALYWVGTDRLLKELQTHNNDVIYRLDLEDYKLDQFCLPQHTKVYSAYFFGALNGTLYLTTYRTNQSSRQHHYQVWKMEQDDAFSWIILFVLPKPDLRYSDHPRQFSGSFHLQLIKVCQDGKFLCLLAGLDFLLFDPVTGSTQVLTDQDVPFKKHIEVFPIESFNFVSLHNNLLGRAA